MTQNLLPPAPEQISHCIFSFRGEVWGDPELQPQIKTYDKAHKISAPY